MPRRDRTKSTRPIPRAGSTEEHGNARAGYGQTFRSLPLILVPHDDGAGGAGEKAHRAALQECDRLGIRQVCTFALEGAKDLNEWLVAKLKHR